MENNSIVRRGSLYLIPTLSPHSLLNFSLPSLLHKESGRMCERGASLSLLSRMHVCKRKEEEEEVLPLLPSSPCSLSCSRLSSSREREKSLVPRSSNVFPLFLLCRPHRFHHLTPLPLTSRNGNFRATSLPSPFHYLSLSPSNSCSLTH